MESQSQLGAQIERELREYFQGTVQVSENNQFSQPKLVRRISLFENHVYPTGKFDSQGNYKFWFDIISPRVDAEVKNIDFDTKDVQVYTNRRKDDFANLVVNLKLKEYLKDTGQAKEINDALEQGSSWGNAVWKKVKGGYERVDLKNFFVINQTAECLDESPAIERHELSQSDLREKSGLWSYVDDVIKNCKQKRYTVAPETMGIESTVPYYLIFERNGEVNVKELKLANNQTPAKGDDDKYVYAKVIAAGVKDSETMGGNVKIHYVMFAQESKNPYKEYHRGRYKGRWFREGLCEMLFDLQVRANQIGNQLAQGLEWASKTIFASEEKTIVSNVLTDLKNGDIIKSKGIQQLQVRMEGLDQLLADWNRVIEQANELANSREVVQGDQGPAGTPFRTTGLLNQNANKLFDFIREKFAIPLGQLFEEWIVPSLIKDLRAQDIVRLTGDYSAMERVYEMIVDCWYLDNLLNIGPHTQEIADTLKKSKIEELKRQPQILVEGLKKTLEYYKPYVRVDITGEGLNLDAEIQTISSLIQLEMDPVRRTAMIEDIGRRKGYDYAGLPKSPPQPVQQQGMNPFQQKVAVNSAPAQ